MDLIEVFKDSDDLIDYHAGEIIIEEGQSGDCLYVVISGELIISLKGKDLGRAYPGEVVGEMALINTETRSATVMAATEAQVAMIDRTSFASLLRHVPDFSIHVMNVLTDRLQKAYDLIEH